ncbi:helix-turn-helix transcriptional regulator [Salinicoccus bachuensis]|uniref:Helix-turn-helix transcriptional regulator n=1 Tax=Salinicoccus bachuensis TaxID=3136731 RepID=A0ABZ3CFW5_9STAP
MNTLIQSMINWIEENLAGEFNLDDLAEYIGYSPYYCSFKFHQITGVTIKSYVKSRRLYLSTKDLEQQNKIIDIAIKYNYSSQESYSRAFKNLYGMTPGRFKSENLPIQSIYKIVLDRSKEMSDLVYPENINMGALPRIPGDCDDTEIMNILNGQHMYDEFSRKEMMEKSDYIPFNEAMCVNIASSPLFDDQFIRLRAEGHNVPVEDYMKKVIENINKIRQKKYRVIVLWFGEDMFCQMNLLTLLAYLEQIGYRGEVYLNSFRDDEFKVDQFKIELGNYYRVYEKLLIRNEFPEDTLSPALHQSSRLYLEMLQEDNIVTSYISRNDHLTNKELVKVLIHRFPSLGYGDSQYMQLISNWRNR